MSASVPSTIGVIAGNGVYPETFISAARNAGVRRLVAAAFHGETNPDLEERVDATCWLRVGQLGRLIRFFRGEGVSQAVMVGQIAPRNLFDLRPDLRALVLIGRLRERNAESLFGAIADELAKEGITLLPATTFLEDHLAPEGAIFGRTPDRKRLADVAFGLRIAKEVSRLDIGQTVVVKRGTVLAVEAFEGTNEAVKRGGALGKGGATLVKVAKPRQDLRFDVPVVGPATVAAAAESGVDLIAVESGSTLLLERDAMRALCDEHGVRVFGTSATPASPEGEGTSGLRPNRVD